MLWCGRMLGLWHRPHFLLLDVEGHARERRPRRNHNRVFELDVAKRGNYGVSLNATGSVAPLSQTNHRGRLTCHEVSTETR